MTFRDAPEEQEDMPYWNFPECNTCLNRMKPKICGDCGVGEHFEEVEVEGVDNLFRS